MRLSTSQTTALAVVALHTAHVAAQTSSPCNPLSETDCKANTALGMHISIDFTQGKVNSFSTSGGKPTYDSSGVTLTVAESGDAPQLNSLFYIMFGRVSITLKAAPGAGIVSSLVLESDDLDEIDMEWLGADNSELQTNYFGKGNVTTYNRGQFNPAPNNQASFGTYTIDWTSERIIWYVGKTAVRIMQYAEADLNQYPQTPMRIKFGAWSGGDAANPAGTVSWARGPTDYSQGPFRMVVRSLEVTDYSTGDSYSYDDTSGSWESIRAKNGAVKGNIAATASGIVATASATTTAVASVSVPLGGIAAATDASDVSMPRGWIMTASGKVVPVGGAVVRTRPCAWALSLAVGFAVVAACLS